jgi:hypothetical protein
MCYRCRHINCKYNSTFNIQNLNDIKLHYIIYDDYY